MSQLELIHKEPVLETFSVEMTVSTTSETELCAIATPVEVVDGLIHLHRKRMIIGHYYPLEYKGKQYLIRKSAENIIDLFEIQG